MMNKDEKRLQQRQRLAVPFVYFSARVIKR